MAAPLKRHGNLAACIVLLACTGWLSSRFNNSAAFERPIHFTIVTLLESGLAIAAWARWRSPWRASHNEGFQLAAFASSRPDWQRWFQAGLNAMRNPVFLLSPSFVLGCAIVLRTLLFWRTVRTIHCSWESFETFLPALIALYTIAAPTTITLQQTTGDHNQRSSRRCFDTSHVRYLLLAIVWACAARATLALSTQPAGAICPPGFFRWETQIPVAQAVTVILDALLVVYLSKWRQDTAEDPPQAWGFASRLFIGSAAALAVLACFSFYNLRNLRWAFALHYVAVRDLAVDGTAASVAVLCGFYLMTDLHPSTLAMITTAAGVYAHQLVRLVEAAAPADGSWLWVISGVITVVGAGLLLRYDKDISAAHNAEQRLMRFLTGLYVVLVGVLCGAYLIFYPDFSSADGLSFPDHLSAEYARSQEWMARAHRSANLSEAVEIYRRSYMVSPPPGFDKWYEYAVENGSPIIDDFNQIASDLLPFWGVPPRVLRERTRHALEYPWLGMGGIRIRGGKAAVAPGTPGSHRWMMESMQRMIEPFAQHLPDMDFAMNLNDECRVSVPHEKVQSLARDAFAARARNKNKEDLQGFDGSSKTPAWGDEDKFQGPKVKSPYFAEHIRDGIYYDYVAAACRPDSPARMTRWWSRKEACRDCLLPHAVRVYEKALENHPVVSNWTAATDLCHQPDLAYLDGFLMAPAAALFTNEAFPVFSQSKTAGFHDILVPSPWNFDDKTPYDENEDFEFEKKENVMFWRGSASDGYAARGSWQGFLRARFVRAANAVRGAMPDGVRDGGKQVAEVAPRAQGADATPSFDVGFVGEWHKCHQADCRAERDTFPPKDPVPFVDHWKYRHLMDLDGAGFSGRFVPFLRSRSLVYRTGVFRTWLAERVHAWRHYVPVDVRLHELRGLLWYFGADYEGRIQAGKIAEEGREWAGKALRKEDMRIYMFRLLLEWGRLVDDERESLGFAL